MPTATWVRASITASGVWACPGVTTRWSANVPLATRVERYRVVGTVRRESGAPGTRRRSGSAASSARTASTSTTVMAMAPLGQPCTQAGASPSARRPRHRSHLRTMPSEALYCGTSYGQVSVQYEQPMHWSSRWATIPVNGSFS